MTSREQRVIRWGAGIALTAAIVLRGLPALRRAQVSALTDLRARADLLAHARREVADAPLLQDTAAAVTQGLVALAPKLLDGVTTAEAMADLTGRLNLAATRHEASLDRTDPVGDSTVSGRLHRITVRIALTSDIRGVVGVLRSLRDGNPVVVVTAIRLMAVDPTSTDHVPEVLKAELTVTGWYLGPPPTKGNS